MYTDKDGYVRDTKSRDKGYGYVYEHTLVVEKAMGRPLPSGAEIHHINGKKDDNRPSNLIVCQNYEYHALIHAKTRRLNDVGSLIKKRCPMCERVLSLGGFNKNKTRWDGADIYCRECASQRKKKRYNEKRGNDGKE